MSEYKIIPITSKDGVALSVEYIPLHHDVNDLHHIIFKRYFEENDLIGVCGVGFRLYPKPSELAELPPYKKQQGIIVLSSEEDINYMFDDAWEGIILRRRLSFSDLKYLTITANQILEKFNYVQTASYTFS